MRESRVCVVGTANFGTGPVWMSTQLEDIEVAPPYVGGQIQRTYVDQGDSSTIAVKLDQKAPFEGKATVTLQGLLGLMSPAEAERASTRSAELKGLLGELQREHSTNRAIMQLELGFLDHLMGMLAIDGVNGYDTHGSSAAITRARPHGGLHVLDLSA